MSADPNGRSRCGYTITDRDGNEEPCDRPATGWRWYQDVEHEDMLDVACSFHANEGGRRLVAAEARIAALEATLAEVREVAGSFYNGRAILRVLDTLAAPADAEPTA